jgi:hypothetical protein
MFPNLFAMRILSHPPRIFAGVCGAPNPSPVPACTPWWWPVCGPACPLHVRVWVHGLTGPTWQCCCVCICMRWTTQLMALGIVISVLMWFDVFLGKIFFRIAPNKLFWEDYFSILLELLLQLQTLLKAPVNIWHLGSPCSASVIYLFMHKFWCKGCATSC